MELNSQNLLAGSDIRILMCNDFSLAAALVRESFTRHIAPDWSATACESFNAEVTPDLFRQLAEAGAYSIGLFQGEALQGVLVMPTPTRLRMIFVDSRCIRQGIGRRLWRQARTDRANSTRTCKLSSSMLRCLHATSTSDSVSRRCPANSSIGAHAQREWRAGYQPNDSGQPLHIQGVKNDK